MSNACHSRRRTMCKIEKDFRVSKQATRVSRSSIKRSFTGDGLTC